MEILCYKLYYFCIKHFNFRHLSMLFACAVEAEGPDGLQHAQDVQIQSSASIKHHHFFFLILTLIHFSDNVCNLCI